MKVLLLHQNGNVLGNVLWPRLPTDDELSLIEAGAERLSQHGYWVSFFPEGDGICFRRQDQQYDRAEILADFSECFSPIRVFESDGPNGRVTLADLVSDASMESVGIRYLVPVDQLLLNETFGVGATTFHAPVDGNQVTLAKHVWGLALCDVPGADVMPIWAPQQTGHIRGTTDFLAYPLIERQISVPSKIFYARDQNMSGHENFLKFIVSDADRALDMLRWTLCSYQKLEFLPNKAGWIGEFAYAYIEPLFGPKKGEIISAKPSVLRVANNWLGLEAQALDLGSVAPIVDVIDNVWQSEMASATKAALRAFGQAYYLTEPEASFLSMLYATDALTGVRNLKGYRLQMWVAAAASKGEVNLFSEILSSYTDLYTIRNAVVHKGKTFLELDRESREINQDMSRILALCIEDIHDFKRSSAVENATAIIERLSRPEFETVAAAHPLADEQKIKFPVQQDRDFKKMI